MAITVTHPFVSTISDGSTLYSGTVTSGSNSITGVSPAPSAGMIGYKVYGTGMPVGGTITNVVGTTVTISANATSSTTSFYTGDKQVQPSDWNASHTISMATSSLLGRTTAGAGTAEEITVAGTLSLSSGTLTGTGATTGKAIAMAIVFGG